MGTVRICGQATYILVFWGWSWKCCLVSQDRPLSVLDAPDLVLADLRGCLCLLWDRAQQQGPGWPSQQLSMAVLFPACLHSLTCFLLLIHCQHLGNFLIDQTSVLYEKTPGLLVSDGFLALKCFSGIRTQTLQIPGIPITCHWGRHWSGGLRRDGDTLFCDFSE